MNWEGMGVDQANEPEVEEQVRHLIDHLDAQGVSPSQYSANGMAMQHLRGALYWLAKRRERAPEPPEAA